VRIRAVLVSCLLAAVCAGEARALTDEEIFEAFQFNFSLPGARSSAMGRAFIGLADDATASVSNPAGLTTLPFPEVSLELKLTDHNIRRRVALVDPDGEPDTRVFGNSVPQLSFLSLVYRAGSVTLGVYRYETFNFDEQFSLPERRLGCCPEVLPLPATDAQIDMAVSNWGGSVAFRLPRNFSFGFAMSAALLDVETRTTRYSPGLPSSISQQTTVNDVAWGLSATLGTLYRPSEIFSAGFFYSFNPTFKIREAAVGLQPEPFEVPVRVRVPDRLGAGVAVRPMDELTLVADVVYVAYSQQTGGNFRTLLRFPSLNPRDFTIDNAWEVHGGLEYVLRPREIPIALRVGTFTNPGHPLRYTGPVSSDEARAASEVFSATSRNTDVALSFGVGTIFARYLQVDVAYVNSALFDEVTASVIFHIEK
jgi:hypothetical protein